MIQQFTIPKETRDQCGMDLAEVIAQAGLAKSKNAARRLIQQSGIKLEDSVIVRDPFARLFFHETTGWLLLET
jgi:tyrosyl-tRNA synthetase